jgi:hypothetical protein
VENGLELTGRGRIGDDFRGFFNVVSVHIEMGDHAYALAVDRHCEDAA